MSRWLYKNETEQLIGLTYEVRNELGGGWSEEIYHQALVYLAKKHSIPCQSKPRDTLKHRDIEIHTFEPDIIFWEKIIFELKVLLDYRGREFPAVNQAQLFQYLRFHKMQVGVLVNFAHSKVGICRLFHKPSDWEIEVDFDPMKPYVNDNDKQILREVYQHIQKLATQYGLGYSEVLYRKLIAAELHYQNIPCVSDLQIPAMYEDHVLGQQDTPCLLVADKFILHVRASLNGIPTHDYIRVRTYLKALGLSVGWLINFGRSSLQIFATTVK